MIDQYGRQWCEIFQIEVLGDKSVTERAVLCSEYCRGRYDERRDARCP